MAPKSPHIFLTGHPGVGKTTIVKALQSSLQNEDACNVVTKGFYTEECRSKGGDRIGFDIIYWSTHDQEPRRAALSRIVDRIKKSDPHVGKYLVNIENVDNFAIKSIESEVLKTLCAGAEVKRDELLIVDEIGKMEMLCTKFIPAVNQVLDENQETALNQRIIIGTIPTPRYGRIIKAVEDIRARDDVLVLHVTKANRDEIKDMLQTGFRNFFNGKAESNLREVFAPFIYTRPIGASSMNCNGKVEPGLVPKNQSTQISPVSRPCGLLRTGNIASKVLLLGQTASSLPSNDLVSYHERSMWIVLGHIFQIDYKPIKDIEAASKDDINTYLTLQRQVLSKGICIWDVFSDVHEKHRDTRKRQKKTKESKPNDIGAFLENNPSVKMIAFIGQKAHKKYKELGVVSTVELITLPSSSTSNTRLCVEEKAASWKDAISKYIPDLLA